MSLFTRGTRTATRSLRPTLLPQTTRRSVSSSSSHDSHHHDSHHSESSHHAETGGTGNEGFGKGFYVVIASIPLLYLTYNLSSSHDNFVERWAQGYHAALAKKDAQDVLHTKALEQAIYDRSVLYASKTNHSRDIVDPERVFNSGSPWNVAAGQGSADLSKLVEHYEGLKKRAADERVERMKQ